MMRVALSATGAAAVDAGLMAPAPAKAASKYYQIFRLWWNRHGAGSWDQCSVPNHFVGFTSSFGFFITGRVAVLAGSEGSPMGKGASKC